jgi:hypothetical protein
MPKKIQPIIKKNKSNNVEIQMPRKYLNFMIAILKKEMSDFTYARRSRIVEKYVDILKDIKRVLDYYL